VFSGGVPVYCTYKAACASLELACSAEHLSSQRAPGKTFLMKVLNMRPLHIKLTKHMHILEIFYRQQVAAMLRGAVGSEVSLKFLETRQVKLTMERCVFMNDGTPSVGIRWKDGSSEMIVEDMMPGYQGFGENLH